MGRSKPSWVCDPSLWRAVFLSPIFVILLICFWAAYAVLLPFSMSLWKDCSTEEYASCPTLLVSIRGGGLIRVQTDAAATEMLLHDPSLPLKLEGSSNSQYTFPARPLLNVVESKERPLLIEQHIPDILPAAVTFRAEKDGHKEADNLTIDTHSSLKNDQERSSKQEIAIAEVVKQINDLRRASNSTPVYATVKQEFGSNCDGKRVFMYDLPAKFNVDLLKMCHKLIPWQNMCGYVSNSGMGTLLEVHASPDGQEDVLVPEGLWYQTHQYALEIVFHERLKQYSCLVMEPELADMLYIPYYGGLDVLRWHFVNNASDAQKDGLGMQLLEWLKEQPAWRKNAGADHVLVLGKISWDFRRSGLGWGSTFLLQEEMQNPTKLLIERQPWHEHDVGVPHPTFFHPRHDRDIRTWQGHIDGAERKHLVSFAGLPRPQHTESIRSQLIQQCLDSITGSSGQDMESSCYFLQCGNSACFKPNVTMGLFIHSEFCLQPPGDSPTRRSIFDSLIAGCIPVLFDPFSAYYQYPWHLPEDPKAYSVYFPAEEVRQGKINVIEELRKIPKSVRREMRLRIIYDIMPGLVYARPGARLREVEDAFLISLRSLLKRISERLNRRGNEEI